MNTIVSDLSLLKPTDESDRNSKTFSNILNHQLTRDDVIADGILNSIALLGTKGAYQSVLECDSSGVCGNATTSQCSSYADALLSLMCLIFDSIVPDFVAIPGLQLDCWLRPLCELIVSHSEHMDKAMHLLKALCASLNYSYASAIDRFIFELSFTTLLQVSQNLFEAAFEVREKAEKCRYRHTKREEQLANELDFASFIGVNDLISEDTLTLTSEKISKMLDYLLAAVTASQTSCWSDYCLSEKINVSTSSTWEPMSTILFNRTPLCLLFWLGCLLTGSNQVKAFKLIEVAVSSRILDVKQTSSESTCVHHVSSDCDSKESHLLLLKKNCSLSLESVYSFVVHFFLYGEVESRAMLLNISHCLILALDDDAMFGRLAFLLLREVGPRGFESIEFIKLLQNLVSTSRISRDTNIGSLVKVVTTAYLSQSQQSSDSDLSCCWSCLRSKNILHAVLKTSSLKLDQLSNQNASSNLLSQVPSAIDGNNPSDLNKYRLDSIASNTAFTDFASYIQLKTRMEIHEIFVNISDPRGRYVKTVNVYFSPRPVSNVADLKSKYTFWQPCGTLSLNRGGSLARIKLEPPVTASNLKIEYKEFYERNEHNRKSDGATSAQCPRCMSFITNSHGVCALCGEVVSRKLQ